MPAMRNVLMPPGGLVPPEAKSCQSKKVQESGFVRGSAARQHLAPCYRCLRCLFGLLGTFAPAGQARRGRRRDFLVNYGLRAYARQL